MALTDTQYEALREQLRKRKGDLGEEKYNEFVSNATIPQQQATTSEGFLQKTGETLGNVFGGNVVGQAIGRQIAKGNLGETIQKIAVGRDLSPEEEALVEAGPSAKQIAGDVAKSALLFTPVAKTASLVQKGLTKLGLVKGTGVASNVVTGAGVGAGTDISTNIAQGEEANLGLGTALGAGIPIASPVIGAIAKASAKLVGQGTAEIGGALTGTSAETLEQAFTASRAGGKQAEQFTEALRGNTTPESLVNKTRENISLISNQRQQLFKETLNELGDTVVPTNIAKNNFRKELESTGITLNEDGTLNFANSKLRTVPNAQSKLQQAFVEINNLPPNATLAQIDTTRQAIKAIKSIAGDEPSANLANMLIDDATRSARLAGEQVDGYGKMLDNFAETSEFLDELNKGLMTSDKTTIDQAYRRMATSLKTNNEQRAILIKELDQATNGAILSEISGQQLSEALPRGIFRQISAGIAGGAVLTGGLTPSLIPALVFASPRVTGEFVRALGLGTQKTDQIIEAIGDARGLLIKTGAIAGATAEPSNNETTE